MSIAALLPAPRPVLMTVRDGPVSLAPEGAKLGALTLPTENAGNYLLLATVSLTNQGALADTASCALIVQAPGRSDPFGLRLANSALAVAAATGTEMTLLADLPNLDPSTLQNGSGAIALWCSGATPRSNFTAATVSLVAIPEDEVHCQ